ncbi:ATP-binding protein [Singulisphaera rosea]
MNPVWIEYNESEKAPPGSKELKEAKETIKELSEILERVQKEPLILYRIDRLSKDGKHAYVKKGDTDLRIEACNDLKQGDEVLLHPKTFQIVERLGKPPLEVSRFAPDKIPNVKWKDIGGLTEAKADLIEAIELPHKNKALFDFYGKKQIKGVLLSGPPGCGKTMLGKASANSLATIYGKENARTGFLYVKGPEILNQYVGQTEQTIRDMFDDARRHKEEHGYPAIIFLDEADAILAARGTRNVGIGNTIVPMFLTEMDGLEESSAIVIIATNRPDVLDPAIVRDGRIDRKVTVTRPCVKSAEEIIRLNLNRVPLQKGLSVGETAQEIASLVYSDRFVVKRDTYLRDIVNGAMLANCISIAVSYAIQRDLGAGKTKTGSGIVMDDVHAAVDRILRQSRTVVHEL